RGARRRLSSVVFRAAPSLSSLIRTQASHIAPACESGSALGSCTEFRIVYWMKDSVLAYVIAW
ncbi:MAG: hypothetical protein MI723_01475, partial [Caulobacterales bacterium]|nr:hypothetical protein [Caulobacterales bacterium]